MFKIGDRLTIKMPKCFINPTVKEVVSGYLYNAVNVSLVETDKPEIIIGDGRAEKFSRDGIISITDKGAYIGAKDFRRAITGLFMVLDDAVAENLEENNVCINIPVSKRDIEMTVNNFMVHICIFPEIPFETYLKLMRLIGVLGYTHAVLEFWGSLKFDCLTELAWKDNSFTKQQAKVLIETLRSFGVQPVPMFNHFGHASGSRLKFGKHVVLDQNLRLAPLFSWDGWWWRFDKVAVLDLLKKIREELYELFGEGDYFHIGFDESFSYPSDEESTEKLCSFINQLCSEVIEEGKTPLLWGDLFLHEPTVGIDREGGYEGNCASKEISEKMFNSLPKQAIVCDWQYFVKKSPWISAQYFKEKGVKTIVCPCVDKLGVDTAFETAKQLNAFGLMQTTWHFFYNEGMATPLLTYYYKAFNCSKALKKVGGQLHMASIMRKVCPADGKYEKAGWANVDVENHFSI